MAGAVHVVRRWLRTYQLEVHRKPSPLGAAFCVPVQSNESEADLGFGQAGTSRQADSQTDRLPLGLSNVLVCSFLCGNSLQSLLVERKLLDRLRL